MTLEYGETWTYESIISALPGIDVSDRLAVAIQFAVFEVAVLVLALVYDQWAAAVAGTVVVVVATAGSVEMLRVSRLVRRESVPESYRQLLFGSSIEVVLAVLSYVGLITYLFASEPRFVEVSLVEQLLGPEPPILAVYLMLLLLWDVCYRIGTGWWASVAALWRSTRYQFDAETTRALQRADLETMGFGMLQLLFVPFLTSHPVLLTAVVGHVVAVVVVTGLSVVVLHRGRRTEGAIRT